MITYLVDIAYLSEAFGGEILESQLVTKTSKGRGDRQGSNGELSPVSSLKGQSLNHSAI